MRFRRQTNKSYSCFWPQVCERKTAHCPPHANSCQSRCSRGSRTTKRRCSVFVTIIPSETLPRLQRSGSGRGASREIFRRTIDFGWTLLATPYVIEEVLANLANLPAAATADWAKLRPCLTVMDDVLTLDRVAVFGPAKDRPILFSALAWADVLLTLDRGDFGEFLGGHLFWLGRTHTRHVPGI